MGNSIKLIADGSLISSSCFQKYLASGAITQLSSTNETLQAQQIAEIQVQFGTNPYETFDTNSSVSTSQSYEPDVLGVSLFIIIFFFIHDLLIFKRSVLLGFLIMLLITTWKLLLMKLVKR